VLGRFLHGPCAEKIFYESFDLDVLFILHKEYYAGNTDSAGAQPRRVSGPRWSCFYIGSGGSAVFGFSLSQRRHRR
jgi:hypothetical protein